MGHVNIKFIVLTACALFSISLTHAAAEKVVDKRAYTLFNPLPKSDWGDMIVDRPGRTTPPYTINPGEYHLEFDIFTYSKDHDKSRHENIKTKSYTVFAPTYRIGILHNLELDTTITAHTHLKTHDLLNHTKTVQHGFGDTLFQIKYNLWGNDGKCKTAFGIIPGVKVPTNEDDLGNHHVEGNLLLPLDIKFTDKFSLNLMTGVKYIRGNSHNQYVWSFPNSGSLSYNLTEKFSTFIELYSEKSTENGSRWDVTFDFGGSYTLSDDWIIDTGMNVGLTKGAVDLNPYVGMSIRF